MLRDFRDSGFEAWRIKTTQSNCDLRHVVKYSRQAGVAIKNNAEKHWRNCVADDVNMLRDFRDLGFKSCRSQQRVFAQISAGFLMTNSQNIEETVSVGPELCTWGLGSFWTELTH